VATGRPLATVLTQGIAILGGRSGKRAEVGLDGEIAAQGLVDCQACPGGPRGVLSPERDLRGRWTSRERVAGGW